MTPSLGDPLPDVLVLAFTRGVSLADWERAGLLEREWALYRLLAERMEIVLATFGGEEDGRIARALGCRAICNDRGLDAVAYEASLPAQVADAAPSAAAVVVKTNQMKGGIAALGIARALCAAGLRTGLMARGGYPWSRFEAWEHGPGSPEAHAAAAEEGALCRGAHLVVGTTRTMVEDLCWRYGLAQERARVIPNYVACAAPAVTDPARRDPGAILFVGRLEAQKRVELLVESLAALAPGTRGALVLRVVGAGSRRARIEALARDRGVRLEIIDPCAHSAVLAQMDRCTLYAQVSAYEGHPKTVLEAMARGCCVLVADAPGLRDVVAPGRTGIIAPPDPARIAGEIARLLLDPSRREALGTSASRRTRDECALERVLDLELDALRCALAPGPQRAHEPPVPPVTWDPALLDADPVAAAAAFGASIRGYARRLDPRRHARFAMAIDAPVYRVQNLAAVETGGGTHPKHRLTRYHDFFVERIEPGWRVIDLGCGGAELAASIASRARAHVVGMDMSDEALARARANTRSLPPGAGTVELVHGDITRDRAGGAFDAIVLSNVLEHLPARPALLRTWLDWYAPARVLVRVPAIDRDWRVAWKQELGIDHRCDPTHEIEYTRDTIEHDLRRGGLDLAEVITRWGEYWVLATPRRR
jgi:SAM-dependent methyltransferase